MAGMMVDLESLFKTAGIKPKDSSSPALMVALERRALSSVCRKVLSTDFILEKETAKVAKTLKILNHP
jgi:hypothetical protein